VLFLALQVKACSHGVLAVVDLRDGINPATRGWW
jgi:hypothetical protein